MENSLELALFHLARKLSQILMGRGSNMNGQKYTKRKMHITQDSTGLSLECWERKLGDEIETEVCRITEKL